jgi:asparagine synthase (glutamine-hydrolysing)
LPLYWLCREAAQDVKVVLSGEGGDELFAGYNYYMPFVIPPWPHGIDYLQKNPGRIAPPLLGPSETASGFPILAGPDERRSMLVEPTPPDFDEWEIETATLLARAREPLQRASLADIAGWLPDDLLAKLDRIAMSHSLEGRAPFLTPGLARCALNLAPDQRMQLGRTKVALRRLAENWLPRQIVERPKQGFVLPMRRWLKEWFTRAGGAHAYFRSARPLPGLNADAVADIVSSDLALGVRRERLLFALVMLTEWWRMFQLGSVSVSIAAAARSSAGHE